MVSEAVAVVLQAVPLVAAVVLRVASLRCQRTLSRLRAAVVLVLALATEAPASQWLCRTAHLQQPQHNLARHRHSLVCLL